MAKMIKVKTLEGKEIFLNSHHILQMYETHEKYAGYGEVDLVHIVLHPQGHGYLQATNTLEDINKQLKKRFLFF